jgi:hypothetical protein
MFSLTIELLTVRVAWLRIAPPETVAVLRVRRLPRRFRRP